MKVAYIHNNKKIWTGAHYINDLIISKLSEHLVDVQSFYPQFSLLDAPINFKGINNILFFYSLLEKRDKILKCDIIQWTTYTPIAFMRFSKPVVSHFGSTTIWFLKAVPKTNGIEKECAEIIYTLKKFQVILEVNLKTLRPLNDISIIEHYAAKKADFVIATSKIVRNNLIEVWIDPKKIEVVHNAIEDYWFDEVKQEFSTIPSIVFLWRIWEDPFTLKLKGVDRLIYLYQQFPQIHKLSIVMSRNKKLLSWMKDNIPNHQLESNIIKTDIPHKLSIYAGSILLITSRYEWFSLSLIEGMSQWLIPICFAVGVVPEIIINGENGYIVNSIYEAEEKIALLISDVNLRRKLSENARIVAQQFGSEVLVFKMITLYEKICSKVK